MTSFVWLFLIEILGGDQFKKYIHPRVAKYFDFDFIMFYLTVTGSPVSNI